MAGFDVVVHFAGRTRRWVSEGAVRWLVNGNSCRLNDTESVYDLDWVLDVHSKAVLMLPVRLVVASAYSKTPELR